MPIKATRTDARTFHGQTAIHRSTLGKPRETGPSGYAMRVEAIPTYRVYFEVPMDAAAGDHIFGDLPAGVWLEGNIVLHSDHTGGAIEILLPAHGGETELSLGTIADASAGPAVQAIAAAARTVQTIDRPIAYSVSGGTAGEVALISVPVNPVDNGWF